MQACNPLCRQTRGWRDAMQFAKGSSLCLTASWCQKQKLDAVDQWSCGTRCNAQTGQQTHRLVHPGGCHPQRCCSRPALLGPTQPPRSW